MGGLRFFLVASLLSLDFRPFISLSLDKDLLAPLST
jgi:hypothetical protein